MSNYNFTLFMTDILIVFFWNYNRLPIAYICLHRHFLFFSVSLTWMYSPIYIFLHYLHLLFFSACMQCPIIYIFLHHLHLLFFSTWMHCPTIYIFLHHLHLFF